MKILSAGVRVPPAWACVCETVAMQGTFHLNERTGRGPSLQVPAFGPQVSHWVPQPGSQETSGALFDIFPVVLGHSHAAGLHLEGISVAFS